MSANKIVFNSDNTLSAIGNYRIISYAEPFYNIATLQGVEDNAVGVPNGAVLLRSFRWSKDGKSWSLWIDFDQTNQSALTNLVLDPANPFYIEFRYMLIDDPTQSPELEPGTPVSPEVTLLSFDFITATATVDSFANYTPMTLCSDEFGGAPILLQKAFTFQPYNVNKGVNLYKDLSNLVNQTFGHEVNYFRVTPQLRSADIVFMEWTLKQAQMPKCIKILVPNNEFPDSKPQYNQFGIDFEIPFEVQIDRGYWESMFGKNTMPQENDFIYFQLLNRMYEVQSTYVFRDFMQQPVYYKVMLIKYQDRKDVLKDAALQAMIDDATISTDELFGEDMKMEIDRVTKPQQYVTITNDQDPIRSMVNRNIPIQRYNLYINWTVVAEHYYNLSQLSAGEDAVVYRAPSKLQANDSRAFACWFAPESGVINQPIRPLLRGRNVNGIGLDIDLVFYPGLGQSQIKITMNTNVTTFPITGVKLEKDIWYALVVNVSNEFAQASVDLMVSQQNTNDLKKIYHRAMPITPAVYDAAQGWKLVASPILMTNIRLFDRMLEEEHQSLVMSQLIVKDSDKAIIIDNAKPILRLPRISNPK